MIGCSRCSKLWDFCECPDLEEVGENRDMFEKDIEVAEKIIDDNTEVLSNLAKEVDYQNSLYTPNDNRNIFTRLDELNEQVKDLGSHYRNEFKGVKVDVYRVLQIFGVTDPVAQHIVKKLLRGTKKGHDEMTVWNEVFQACERKKEMIEEEKDD